MKSYTNHILKAAFLGCFFILFSSEVTAQARFNVRDTAIYSNTRFHGIAEQNGEYLIIGNGNLIIDNSIVSSMFSAKYDLNGVFIESNPFLSNNTFVLSILSGVKENESLDRLSVVGASLNQESGFVANFSESGDTVSVLPFTSYYAQQLDPEFSFVSPLVMEYSTNSDNSFFISTNIFNPETTATDCYIQRMNPEGETLWQYVYATNSNPDACYAMLPTEDGGVLALIYEFNTIENRLVLLDDSGNVLINQYSEIDGVVRDLIPSEGGDIILSGGAQSSDGYVTGRLAKINYSGEYIWDTIVGVGEAQSFQNQFYKVVKSLDDSGYVAGGTKEEFMPEEEQTDSTGTTITQGWLVKVNDDGDVLWERKYHYINTPSEQHTLNDLKATSDGGYIFCGESRDWDEDQEYSEGPFQQGWLVKVDEYGCLVEGCHLTDDISIIDQDSDIQYFKAGPIPAGQFLNIYQTATAHLSTFQLINSYGQVVEEFPAMSKGTTMMLPVGQFAAGSYQLVLIEGGRVLQMEKIVIN